MHTKEQLIHKLFHGSCSRAELVHLFELIEADPAITGPEVMLELAAQMKQIPALDRSASDSIFDKIESSLADQQGSASVIPLSGAGSRSRNSGYWYAGIAASFLLLIGVIWGLQETAFIQHETLAGEIKTFTLPDNSTVTLNGKTTLRYAAEWAPGVSRVVHLQGEAYFQVEKMHATQAKFQVITPELTVEVLGTAFNVNSRKAHTHVFLDEGKVKINLDHQVEKEVVLQPGELLSYSTQQKGEAAPKRVDGELHTSWKTGVMVFKDAALTEILDRFSVANELTFEIRDPALHDRKFTFGLPVSDLTITLAALERLIGEEITREGNQIMVGTTQ